MTTLDKIKADVNREYKWLVNTKYTIHDVDIAFGHIRSCIDKYAEQEPTSPCELCKFNTKLMLIEANVSGYTQGLKESSKTGHWDFFCQHWRKCSECGFSHKFAEDWEYCPNCGAKMVEPTCDTCEYNTAAFMPCNACEDKSEYKPQESEVRSEVNQRGKRDMQGV